MGRNINNERVQIYLKNPEYFKEKLHSRFKKRDYEVATAYLAGGVTLFQVGRMHHMSKERVRQIVYKALLFVFRSYIRNKEIIFMKEEIKTEEEPKKNGGGYQNKITQQEFDEIKELQFRGETIGDIMNQTGKSYYTIKGIELAKDLTDYRDNKLYQAPHKRAARKLRQQETIAPQTLDHYAQLTQAKQHLDMTIIAFIKAEIETQQNEKITQLEAENKHFFELCKQYSERIKELEQSQDFATTLKQTLTKEETNDTV